MAAATLKAIAAGTAKKGDVIAVARTAGIMAAKRTADLIPLCHPLSLSQVTVDIAPLADGSGLEITAEVRTTGPTGVEMEALTAASVTALTLYDMVKAVDKDMVIGQIRLDEKDGGRSGQYRRGVAAATSATKTGAKGRRTPAARPAPVTTRSADPGADGRRALQAFIGARGLKVTEWAKSANVRSGEVFSFLSGRAGLSPESAKRLADAAGVSVGELFGTER